MGGATEASGQGPGGAGGLGRLRRRRAELEAELALVKRRIAAAEAGAEAGAGTGELHRLRAVLASVTGYAVLTTDAAGVVTGWNPGAQALMGWTEAEALGLDSRTLFTPEDAAAGIPEQEMADALALGLGVGERWHVRRDGTRYWANELLMPLRGAWQGFVKVVRDRTEQHRAGVALRASEARLQDAFAIETVGMMFWGLSEGYPLKEANDAFLRMVGYAREEAIGLTSERLTCPEFHAATKEKVEEAGRTGVLPAYEKQMFRRDGSRAWALCSGRMLEGELFEVVIDVTERRRAESALRESEARLAASFESVPAGVAVIDMAGAAVIANSEFRRFLPGGTIPSRDPAGAGRWRAWDDKGQPIDPQDFPGSRAMRGERVVPGQEMLYTDDQGREIWTRVGTVPVRDAAGRATGTVVVISDIDALKRSAEALRASEELLRGFGEASSDVLWIRDADTLRWEYLTPAFEAIYGLGRERALGGDDLRHWAEFILPDDQEGAMRSLARVRDGERVALYRIRRPLDGEVRWVRDADFPMRDAPDAEHPEGRVVRIGGIGRDVTEEKRAAERQRVLVAELQHRTRNLLAVVRNVARSSIRPSPGLDEYDARLAALGRVQGFLSRSPAYSVPLAELVGAELAAVSDGASGRVTVEGPAVTLPGEGVQAVALALHELATNAVKYGATAQPSGRLSVTWRVEGSDGAGSLVILWPESGVAMHGGSPAHRGYGSELIAEALPYQLDTETELQFTSDGVRCRIALPPGAFSSSEEAQA